MLPVLPSNSTLIGSSVQRVERKTPSMIFRIEHLLPSASPSRESSRSTPPSIVDQAALTRRKDSGVLAAEAVQKDTSSKHISTLTLISFNGIIPNGTDFCKVLGGNLSSIMEQDCSWLRRIKLSEDVHSYNVVFEVNRQSSSSVQLRAIKDIQKGEELVAWFSEELAILMSIPFLTPSNIEGNKRYTCHLCGLSFETPNPLKIHIALACGRHSLDILWIRLHYAMKASMFAQLSTVAPCPTTMTYPTTTTSRLSAFKPISSSMPSLASSISINQPRMFIPLRSSPPQHPQQSPSQSIVQPPMNPMEAAAQIEAIVSNMGTSKQGHLCIYCGKVYSRKYGLKIHIRTHTGFKPLKCKFCLRPFGDPSNLNKHVRLHLQPGTSAYKCHLCNKTLARRRDLQRHMESRHSNGHNIDVEMS
ncbi:PR domain zinc finger protein 13 [Episyrphus balteatus]|uniref:PR domain zinc finger protein 13 n=1 Tax=Episyrphus balteatus TaxID=286459 RepID=UPI0024869F68|nr:PR domain zinc finger protein 13 [Episyrphus balteatus]